MLLSKLSNGVNASVKGVAYTIVLTESQRDTTTGAAVAYSIEALPAFDDGMDKTFLMALP